jgi:uncharacterized protein (DUF983 family)
MATVAQPKSRFSLKAMLTGRCPRCRQGRVFPPFLSRRFVSMNQTCDVCGLKFEREPGYFLGAMYFSYTLGVLTILPVSLLLILVAGWDLAPVMVVMVVQTLISMPLFFRYSRVMWLHLDLAFIPIEEKQNHRRR